MQKRLFAVLLSAISLSLAAQDVRKVSFVGGLGLTVGGEDLATVRYTDGSSKSISSGGLFFFKGGADWTFHPRWSFQATYGLHQDSANAKNGKMEFERNFMEGIGYFHTTGRQRLGLGMRKTMDAKVSSSGASDIGTFEFNSSTGLVLEYEWVGKTGPRGFGFSIRYVNEKYTPATRNGAPVVGPDIDGSHLGIGLNFYL